jgi:hypothetical protein
MSVAKFSLRSRKFSCQTSEGEYTRRSHTTLGARVPLSPFVVPRVRGEPLSCPAARPSGSPSLGSHSVAGLDLKRTWSVRGWVCRMPRAAGSHQWSRREPERLVYDVADCGAHSAQRLG